ncbi:MAG: hypothetical protein U0441_26785 [Polyangiaceae bacterium]
MFNRPILLSLGALLTASLLVTACGPGASSSSGGGGAGGGTTSSTGGTTTGGTGGTGGASTGGTAGSSGTTTGTSALGNWHAGWIVSVPTTGGDDAIGKLGPTGVTVASMFQGTVTFPDKQATAPASGQEGYVARYGLGGQFAWSTIFEATDRVFMMSVDVDASDRVLVGGYFRGDLTLSGQTLSSSPAFFRSFVALLDTDGSLLWLRTIGDLNASNSVESAAFAPDGSVIVSGEFDATFDLDGTSVQTIVAPDMYVAKLSAADGKRIWSRALGGTDIEFVFNASVDPAGDVLLSGVYAGDIDFGTGPLPTGPADGYGYLAKLSGADGTATFAREIGAALGYVAGAPDGFYFAGTLNGAADFGGGEMSTTTDLPVVAAYGLTGDFRWNNQYGEPNTAAPVTALPDADAGGLAAAFSVTGFFDFADGNGPVQILGGEDIFFGAFPTDNAAPQIFKLGGPGGQTPGSVSLGGNGTALVVGHFINTFTVSPVDSGSGTVTSQGLTDTFLLYLVPN